jgi:hypothetical protein
MHRIPCRLMATVGERLSTLEAQVSELRADIHGPPWEGSMREKGHSLAGRVAVLEAAGQVLVEAQRERRRALDERDTSGRRRRSEAWKLLAALTGLIAVVGPYIERFV